MSAAAERARTRVRVVGTVQGVGFRPFVYRLAGEEGLAGYVFNDEHGVLVEVEGADSSISRFMARLTAEAPPLAVIDTVVADPIAVRGERGFQIVQSARSGPPDAPVTPDSAICDDCLGELFTPGDRRHRYPFINCTNCGPRFTIVRGIPYDRPQTTMAAFEMCADCRREYEDPSDRRFHAQPNACPVCGPSVRLAGSDGRALECADPIAFAAAQLAEGMIVAVKGLGGYHLAADAACEPAVSALRARKHREDRPFALMVADLERARGLVALGVAEEALLCSPRRPIVLGRRLVGASVGSSLADAPPDAVTPGAPVADAVAPGAPVADAVAPGAPELGLMLPYTPLHHLLMADFGGPALVMTSGNVSDEPIAFRDEDALERLRGIADLFLLHDREIETRTDDSVVRVVSAGRPLLLRRSRGYVPAHISLPVEASEPLLACGAEQKSTFCVAKGSRAWVSHHIGDLEHVATLQAFTDGVAHFERLFAAAPALVAHDLHPDYLSTSYALARENVSLLGVQHHHAHLAACLAEHGCEPDHAAVGAIFDGTGYGTDGSVWGGELLVGSLLRFDRAGSLRAVRMPGAAAAIRQPWRMAFAWLAEAFGSPVAPPPPLAVLVDPRRWDAIAAVAASPRVSPLTSSMGRLFDAVGAMCGIAAEVTYEGQAAVELEAAAWRSGPGSAGAYEFELHGSELDPRPAIQAIANDLASGVDPAAVSAGFHTGLARATVSVVTRVASYRGLDTAVLSGGVFQNRLLLETIESGLTSQGLRVLVPELLPPNDGGISYGQAAIAAATTA